VVLFGYINLEEATLFEKNIRMVFVGLGYFLHVRRDGFGG
jgi:hypothetical protein